MTSSADERDKITMKAMTSDLTPHMVTQSISFPGKPLPAEDGAWRPWDFTGLPNVEYRQQWDDQHIPAAALTLVDAL